MAVLRTGNAILQGMKALRQFFFQLFESLAFAATSLRENLLRTTLSLLGVTIGIFAIIMVLTLVDSLERSIRSNLSFMGNNVLYVQKWPWVFTNNYPWWKYFDRPVAKLNEYRFLERNLQHSQSASFFAKRQIKNVKYQSNVADDITLMGGTYNFRDVSDVRIASGRYFTRQEAEGNAQVAIIGAEIAEDLFGGQQPLGKVITVKGRKFSVIAVMEKQGSVLGMPSNDEALLVPYAAFASMFNMSLGGVEPAIALKAFDDDKNMNLLEGEVRALMRSRRGLKPLQDDNFALNRPELLSNAISGIFGVLGLAGAIIGSFSMLVGGFGIANIMFVSVKERTNLIGIQKALGARNYFILGQFLFEAMILSLLGGAAGLLIVFGITFIPVESFDLMLSVKNVLTGLAVSAGVGLLAGITPAWAAARMDPVEAIRSK